MNVPTKLGAYAAGLAVVFAAALGVGAAVGPVGPAAGNDQPAMTTQPHDGGTGTGSGQHG